MALKTLKLIKDWYKARALEGLPTKNINSMSVMYSVACLLELDTERGHSIFDQDERNMYSGWIDEWAEWVMNDLPRKLPAQPADVTDSPLISRDGFWRVPAQ